MKLSVIDHSRDSAQLTYVYPVVSRRAGGVSIGINLNPNNACNFRCVYCQVPGLVAGKGPAIDVDRLETELRGMLTHVLQGDFMQRCVPQDARRLNDVAFSGNGEPTSSPQFEAAIERVGSVLHDFGLLGKLKLIVITNGSLTDRSSVERAVERLAMLGGELWFKLDSATPEGAYEINSTRASLEARVARLERVARRCPTWIQTCVFALDGAPPSAREQARYHELLCRLLERNTPLRGIQLYGLARPSLQPEAPRLSRLGVEWLETFAQGLRSLGIAVQVNA